MNPAKTTTVNDSICDGMNYIFNGISYTVTGIYEANLLTSEGCDSTVTLNLTVNPNLNTVLNDTICDGASYPFNGGIITSSGTYFANLLTTHGCDSIVVLNLTVNPSYSITLNEEICDGSSYPFNGTNLSTDGVYIAALLTEEGCDSVVTLNLAVKPTVTTTVHDTICDGGSYTFNGSTYTTSCLLYTSPSPRDATLSRMPSSA